MGVSEGVFHAWCRGQDSLEAVDHVGDNFVNKVSSVADVVAIHGSRSLLFVPRLKQELEPGPFEPNAEGRFVQLLSGKPRGGV